MSAHWTKLKVEEQVCQGDCNKILPKAASFAPGHNVCWDCRKRAAAKKGKR